MCLGTVLDIFVNESEAVHFIDIFNAVSEYAIFVTLIIFVFEMRSVKIKIESYSY